jgi:hypothetical protein
MLETIDQQFISNGYLIKPAWRSGIGKRPPVRLVTKFLTGLDLTEIAKFAK